MSVFKQSLLGLCTFAALLMLTPGARASEWDQKVVATFNAPVEIPGQVLPTGTYVFKVLDIVGSRDVVRVFNADESKVLATAFTVTRYRSTPTDNAVFMFEERGTDQPQALRAWYYPGYVDGHQFIYAPAAYSTTAAALSSEAPANPPSAPAASSPLTSDEPKIAEPTPAAEPQSTPSADTQSQTTPSTSPAPSTPTDQSDKELPKTATTMPLIALIGTLLLAGAAGLKALASRAS